LEFEVFQSSFPENIFGFESHINVILLHMFDDQTAGTEAGENYLFFLS